MARSRDVLRFLAGLAARGRLIRRLSALSCGLSGRQRLSCASRGLTEGDSGKDGGESRARQTLSRQSPARRRHSRPQRLEQALGRAGRLSRHGGAAAAGIQKAAAGAQAGGLGDGGRERSAIIMVSAFKQPLTADDIKDQGPCAWCRSGRHRRRRAISNAIRPTRAIRAGRPTSPNSTAAASSCWPSA